MKQDRPGRWQVLTPIPIPILILIPVLGVSKRHKTRQGKYSALYSGSGSK